MFSKLLPLSELISAINSRTDPIDEWGEWVVSYHFQYLLEGEQTDIESLLLSILNKEDVKTILCTHLSDFKLIEQTYQNYKHQIIDFSVNQFGITLLGKTDEETITAGSRPG